MNRRMVQSPGSEYFGRRGFVRALVASAIGISALFATPALGKPFEIQVDKPTMAAVQSAIDSCPKGYSERLEGCEIHLPSGTIRGRWKIGGATTSSTQIGVCLIGQGPGWGSTWPEGKIGAGGTTLAYEGAPGGVLLDIVGGDYVCVRNLTLVMGEAGVGLRLGASNTGSALTQLPVLDRVTIAGNIKKPSGIGLHITGAAKNDQVDALIATSLNINDTDVGIEVDSYQAVTNRIGPGSKISGASAAVRIRRGSLSLDGVLAQCRTANCCTYDLLEQHNYLRVRDGYHEIGGPPARNAKLICLNRESSAAVGSWHVVSLVESYVNVLCDSSAAPCFIDLLNGRSSVTVTFRDNWILGAGAKGSAKDRFVRVVMPSASGRPRLVWAGNTINPDMGEILAQIGEGVAVEALADDGKRTWNDRNLNGRWDADEPIMGVRP
jgi:hypothetical protein